MGVRYFVDFQDNSVNIHRYEDPFTIWIFYIQPIDSYSVFIKNRINLLLLDEQTLPEQKAERLALTNVESNLKIILKLHGS